jgi:hypothetical protein
MRRRKIVERRVGGSGRSVWERGSFEVKVRSWEFGGKCCYVAMAVVVTRGEGVGFFAIMEFHCYSSSIIVDWWVLSYIHNVRCGSLEIEVRKEGGYITAKLPNQTPDAMRKMHTPSQSPLNASF